ASGPAPRRVGIAELYVPQAAAEDGPHPWHKQKKLQLCRWLKYSPAAEIGQLALYENPHGYTGWYTHQFEGGEDLSKALTQLSADEEMFRETVREFARDEIAPLVRTMDEAQKFDAGLLKKLHELGLMGIQVPEEFGGAAGTLFEAVLAVEEISAVDPAVGVLVDVQNTLVISALMRWANPAQKKQWLPKLAKNLTGAYALSEAASGSDAFALQCRAVKDGDS